MVLECPVCDGGGCDGCDDGHFELAICPMEYVTDDVWTMLQYVELYGKGIPPVAGGALDQAEAFNVAARLVWNEQRRCESERSRRRK